MYTTGYLLLGIAIGNAFHALERADWSETPSKRTAIAGLIFSGVLATVGLVFVLIGTYQLFCF